MEKVIVSFIVPIFNGEKHLKRCIDSLLNQNIPFDMYEIVFIDDCSQDNSIDIIKECQNTYPNIKLIVNEKNLKTATACNIGVNFANGEYIWLVGQDDWIKENCLEMLFNKCVDNNLDIIVFNYNRVNEKGDKIHSAEVFKNSEVLKGDKFIRDNFSDCIQQYLLGYEWRALFKKDFLISNNIRFTDGAIYEDTTYLFKAILFADRFQSISDYLYNYRVNTNSITDINKKYRGALIYEFAFVAGNEVLELSELIKVEYNEYSQILERIAGWYFKSFSYKIIYASLKEKKTFYALVNANKNLVSNSISFTNSVYKLLVHPFTGIIITIFLKPLYLLKRKIKNRNKLPQDWCY
jgi:glycosyltransferase involved in cell wall biosynthesis